MDVFRKCLHVFDILHDCVGRSRVTCVCQLSLNEYMMMMMMSSVVVCRHRHHVMFSVVRASPVWRALLRVVVN